jgi:hypothetical protein
MYSHAQVLKVTLVNLCYAIIGVVDPLIYIGGRYETHHHSEPLADEVQEEIATLLTQQHVRDTLFWALIAAVSIANIVFAGLRAESKEAQIGTLNDCWLNHDANRDTQMTLSFIGLNALVCVVGIVGSVLLSRAKADSVGRAREQNKSEEAGDQVTDNPVFSKEERAVDDMAEEALELGEVVLNPIDRESARASEQEVMDATAVDATALEAT